MEDIAYLTFKVIKLRTENLLVLYEFSFNKTWWGFYPQCFANFIMLNYLMGTFI